MNPNDLEKLKKLGYTTTLSAIGSGGYATAYLVEKDGLERVIKLNKKRITTEISFAELRECIFMKSLQDCNCIVNVTDIVLSIEESLLGIELEKMDSNSVFMGRKPSSKLFFKKYIYSIVKALYYIHSMGYTHNDIKPENVLFSAPDTFKLTDFGLCNYMGYPIPEGLNTFSGTTYYKAPNSADDKFYKPGNKYGYNSDMYSVGCIMYKSCMELLLKYENINVIDPESEGFRNNRGHLVDMFGESGVDFIERCLDNNSSTRMTSKEALYHPYLKRVIGSNKPNSDFLENIYENYKDVFISIPKIKKVSEYYKNIEKALKYILDNNKFMNTFIQYIFIFHTAIRHFPDRDYTDLSLVSLGISIKLYESNPSNVILVTLRELFGIKTALRGLVILEMEILRDTSFILPLIPIDTICYYNNTSLNRAIITILDKVGGERLSINSLDTGYSTHNIPISILKMLKTVDTPLELYEAVMEYNRVGDYRGLLKVIMDNMELLGGEEYREIREAARGKSRHYIL
jgi:serine/threonine protein kinase